MINKNKVLKIKANFIISGLEDENDKLEDENDKLGRKVTRV